MNIHETYFEKEVIEIVKAEKGDHQCLGCSNCQPQEVFAVGFCYMTSEDVELYKNRNCPFYSYSSSAITENSTIN
jgi:hypothetical protein